MGLGVSAAGHLVPGVISDRIQRRFRERLTVALESHVARLQASVATIEHHERPEFLNRLAMLRDQVFVLDHMYMSLFSTCGWILRLGVTMALLVSIHPALALWRCSRCRRCSPRRGDRASSALPRAGRAGEPAGTSPIRDGHHGAAGQGGARDAASAKAWWPSAARRGNGGTGPVAAARWGQRLLAHARLGGLRRRVRGRRGVCLAR